MCHLNLSIHPLCECQNKWTLNSIDRLNRSCIYRIQNYPVKEFWDEIYIKRKALNNLHQFKSRVSVFSFCRQVPQVWAGGATSRRFLWGWEEEWAGGHRPGGSLRHRLPRRWWSSGPQEWSSRTIPGWRFLLRSRSPSGRWIPRELFRRIRSSCSMTNGSLYSLMIGLLFSTQMKLEINSVEHDNWTDIGSYVESIVLVAIIVVKFQI